ncbi:hypothetical protein CJ179_38365 [Rhodococcus sp. ACS1]|uniref:hypothetical protein n=1 Tax=Rhodococcus sp. ACS1 TaxID=2028570 RepID=UPI000BB0E431|nr:hypothetical protein [Rhodococcus sp. ACS1]PBC38473.1 hypothetical protein CJ179_38365 [Rhodococcus sp. ACS1]
MGAYASATDVEDRFEGSLSSEQLTWVGVMILDAEALLSSQIPRLADPFTASAADQANAKRVICESVLKVLRNPGGFQSESTGPWTATRFPDGTPGQLSFTKEQLAVFRRTRKKRVGMIGVAPARWAETS